MLSLWCARRLTVRGIGTCPQDVYRFKFSCLFCRIRRAFYGKFTKPQQYVKYTYRNVVFRYLVDRYIADGFEYRSASGKKLLVTRTCHVLIDPRGHFTRLRCAIIQVLDSLMGLVKRTKPLIEFAEFLANFPTW
jgi:hypothetical protein